MSESLEDEDLEAINCHPLFSETWIEQEMKKANTEEALDVKEEVEARSARILAIYIGRRDGAGGKKYEAVPTSYEPEELTEPAQIAQMFGGGDYEVVARGKGGFIGKAYFKFAGKPKPLADETEETKATTVPAGGSDTTALIMAMMQMQQSQAQHMLTMMMENSKESAKSNANLIASVLTFVGTMSSRGPQIDPAALVRQGMELSQSAQAQALANFNSAEDDDDDEEKPKSLLQEASDLAGELKPMIDMFGGKKE